MSEQGLLWTGECHAFVHSSIHLQVSNLFSLGKNMPDANVALKLWYPVGTKQLCMDRLYR